MAGEWTGLILRAFIVACLFGMLSLVVAVGSTPAGAEGDPDLAGEWWFAFTPEVDRSVSTVCIASLVSEDRSWSLPMSCDAGLGFGEFVGTIDKSGGFAFVADVSVIEMTLLGTVDLGARPPLTGSWRSTTNERLHGTFVGNRGPYARGLVRCPEQPIGPFPGRRLSSIDAVLIQQYHAGLIESLPCRYLGDANVDGVVNAIDAQLVLQRVARVIERFPPL